MANWIPLSSRPEQRNYVCYCFVFIAKNHIYKCMKIDFLKLRSSAIGEASAKPENGCTMKCNFLSRCEWNGEFTVIKF